MREADEKELEERFRQIKEVYNIFYRGLLQQGKLNCRDTGIGFWGCSSPDAVFEFFKEIKLHQFRNFIDIGSGDGIVVLIAALFTDAAGVEFDKELHNKAIEMRDKLGIKAELMNCNISDISLAGYDLIYINPDKSFTSSRIEKKVLGEMKGILVVYNNIFRPNLLNRGKTFWHDQIPITIWTGEDYHLILLNNNHKTLINNPDKDN